MEDRSKEDAETTIRDILRDGSIVLNADYETGRVLHEDIRFAARMASKKRAEGMKVELRKIIISATE